MADINVLGIFVGKISRLPGHFRTKTAINKHRIRTMQLVTREGIWGDTQADRKHHGGPERSLHHYAKEHYAYWEQLLKRASELPVPGFGENILTYGVTEKQVCVGDIFKLGTCTIQVSQPRTPCSKLNMFLDDDTVHKHVLENAKCGWFYRVLEEGFVWDGASLSIITKDPANLSIHNVFKAIYTENANTEILEKIAEHEFLSRNWRKKAFSRIENAAT